MSTTPIDGLEYIGLSLETLSLQSLAQALVGLHTQFLEEKTRREDLQEQLFTVRDAINKNIKPLINDLEEQLEQLNNDTGDLYSKVKKISTELTTLTTTQTAITSQIGLLSQENDVIFDQLDEASKLHQKMNQSVQHLENRQNVLLDEINKIQQIPSQTISKPIQQVSMNQVPQVQQQPINSDTTTTTSTSTPILPSQDATPTSNETPIQQQQQQQQQSLPTTTPKKVYIPKSQRGAEASFSPTTPSQSTPHTTPPTQTTSTTTTTTPGKVMVINDAGKNMLKHAILSSMGQKGNPTIMNTKSNAHDLITKGDRPGKIFYSRSQLQTYRPTPTDTISYLDQVDDIQPIFFKSNLAPDTYQHLQQCLSSQTQKVNNANPDDDNTNNTTTPEDDDSLPNNHIESIMAEYTQNTNNIIQPLTIAHIPRYLTLEHAENKGTWIGTHREIKQQHIQTIHSTQQQQQHYQQQRSQQQYQKQQQLREDPSYGGPNAQHAYSNQNNDKWGKMSSEEQLFIQFQKFLRMQGISSNNNNTQFNNNNNMNDSFDFDRNDMRNRSSMNNNNTYNSSRSNQSNNAASRRREHQQAAIDSYRELHGLSTSSHSTSTKSNKYGQGSGSLHPSQEFDRFGNPIVNKIRAAGSYINKMEKEEQERKLHMMKLQGIDIKKDTNNNRFNFDDDDTNQYSDDEHNDDNNNNGDNDGNTIKPERTPEEIRHELHLLWIEMTCQTIQLQLNKITLNKIEQFANEIATLLSTNDPTVGPIPNELQLSSIVQTIINRSTKEISMISIYAELCFLIGNHPLIKTLQFEKDPNGHYGKPMPTERPLTFRYLVIAYCQELLQTYTTMKSNELWDSGLTNIQPEDLKRLHNDLMNKLNNNENNNNENENESSTTPSQSLVGKRIHIQTPTEGRIFCRFLGELYKFGILPSQACCSAMNCLFSTGDEEDVIAAVGFMTSVLPKTLATHTLKTKYNLSLTVPFPIDQYIPRFESIRQKREFTTILTPPQRDNIDSTTTQPKECQIHVSLRTKFLVMDFLDAYTAASKK